MKTIYIDTDFKCHVTNNSAMTAVQTDVFDGKCDAYIEGYRFVPFGETWKREDGEIFSGEMVAPFKNFDVLEMVQKLYEESSIVQADVDAMLVDCEYRLTMLELGVEI